MSEGQKFFERPKVRFSQPTEDSSINSEKPDDDRLYSTSNKPRIKSIVTLEDPFKIIYKNGDLPSTSKANVDNRNTQYSSKPISIAQSTSEANFQRPISSLENAECKISHSKPVPPSIQKSFPGANKSQITSRKDNSVSHSPVPNDIQNSKSLPSASNLESSKSSATCKSRLKISTDTERSNFSSASKNIAQIKTGTIPKSVKTSASKIGSRHTIPKTIPFTVKKGGKKTTPVSNENLDSAKNTVSKNTVSKITRQKEKIPAKGSAPSLSRGAITAKTVSCGLKISKPGTKAWKIRSKSSPVKKSILRDATGHPRNVYVGPGVARYYSQPFKINVEKETPHIRPDIISGEKLGKPEYNSIMCTIHEIKKVQAEKFVTDVEHLPSVYRNLVNEKVSAALDFPPDEAIYKNLVDLSVNDNQLPSRLTRSKDPEPRHRDIVPKLSDFFTPKYSEEYCAAVQIRPRSPEIFSRWSAFAISDKIFGWKHDMDQCN